MIIFNQGMLLLGSNYFLINLANFIIMDKKQRKKDACIHLKDTGSTKFTIISKFKIELINKMTDMKILEQYQWS